MAQLYGAKRENELRRAASTLLITQAVLGTALAIFGSVGAELLVVGLMRVTDEGSRLYAIEYFAIYAVGLIFQYVYNAVAGILRAVGDSKASMYFLIVSAVLNTILDLWFVIGFGWGVVGVAVATVIAQAVCAASASSIWLSATRFSASNAKSLCLIKTSSSSASSWAFRPSYSRPLSRWATYLSSAWSTASASDHERFQCRQPHGELRAHTHLRHEQRRWQASPDKTSARRNMTASNAAGSTAR